MRVIITLDSQKRDSYAALLVAKSIRVDHLEKSQPFLYPKYRIAILPKNMFNQPITYHVESSKPNKSILGR